MYRIVTSTLLLMLFGRSLLATVAIGQPTRPHNSQGATKLFQPTKEDISKPQSPWPSDLTESQATQKALFHIGKFNLPVPRSFASKTLTYDQFFCRIWQLQSADYLIHLDSTSGSLVRFNNYGREAEQVRGHNRQRVHRIQSNTQAKALLWYYARRIGLPSGAYLSHLQAFNDGDSRIADANPAGSINGVFTLSLPGGYSYYEGHGPCIGFRLDPLDGAVVYCVQEWRVYPDKATIRVSSKQAVSSARSLYSEYRTRYPGPTQRHYTLEADPKVPLKYVMLNFRPILNDPHWEMQKNYPRKARLAWIVRFGKDEIWIDAENGTQLGAIIY